MAPSDYSFEYFQVSFPAEHVAHVEINRPEKMNAFKEPMWSNLGAIFKKLSTDDDVRCVVLSGKGDRAFTAGLDVAAAGTDGVISSERTGADPARTAFRMKRVILQYQAAVTPIEKCEKRGSKPLQMLEYMADIACPAVICVLHGYSFGAAIDIATACDIRVCAEGTKLCVKEVDIGLAADVGTLSRLPKCGVSMSWIKDVCYTARVFDPSEALRVGFVSHVARSKEEAIKAALQKAALISEKSPVAVQGTKNIIDYSKDHSTEDGLSYTAVWNSAMLQTEDVPRAIQGGLSKQKIAFEKL